MFWEFNSPPKADGTKRNSVNAACVALLAISGMLVVNHPAAADDCCADLEERIAELESMAARKGNRKVSVTISGRVSQQMTYWNDGVESDVYITGAGAPTHFKFTGSAQIDPRWSAGYILQMEMFGPQRYQLSQDDSSGVGPEFYLWQSAWYIDSKDYGRLSVGRQSHGSDDTALGVDASGSLGPANWVLMDGSGYFVLVDGIRTGFKWNAIVFCQHISGGFGADCNGATTNSVRYDTPTMNGFLFSASWGEDDFWDVAVRYGETHGDIKVNAAAAYSHNTKKLGGTRPNERRDSSYTQAGIYLEHMPTGLFVHGAYGREDNDHKTEGGRPLLNSDVYYVKAGVRHRWLEMGTTVLFAEAGQYFDMLHESLLDNGATSSQLDRFGVGVVQEIDAASMSVWLKYRRNTGSVTNLGGVAGRTNFDAIDFVSSGATINF